jgi:nucleoside-diphosphate-sugar epimerase
MKVGCGDNQLPLIYAGNVASAIWKALIIESSDFRVFLCANDGKVTQNEFLESLARATNAKRSPLSIPKSTLLVLGALQENLSALFKYRIQVLLSRYVIHLLGSDWSFDQSRIREELDYSSKISYEQGFAETEAWYRQSRAIL